MIHPRRYSSFASKQQMIVPRGGQTLRLSGFSLLHHKISLILQPRRRCFRLERKNHKKDEKFLRGVSSASISISEFKLLYVTMKLHFWSWNFEISKWQKSTVIYFQYFFTSNCQSFDESMWRSFTVKNGFCKYCANNILYNFTTTTFSAKQKICVVNTFGIKIVISD